MGQEKKREEAATNPVLDSGSVPELLDCVVDIKPVPKFPSLLDEEQSIKSTRLVSGTAMKHDIIQSYQEKLGQIIPSRLQTII